MAIYYLRSISAYRPYNYLKKLQGPIYLINQIADSVLKIQDYLDGHISSEPRLYFFL